METKIEALRARKRELLERRKQEAASGGDPLALLLVDEELRETNAKLRALAPARAHLGRKKVSDPHFLTGRRSWADRAAFVAWSQADNGDSGATRTVLLSAMRDGRTLTERQRQMLSLRRSGLGVSQIARELEVNPSTVSRTLKRAEDRIRQDGERRLTTLENGRVDLANPGFRDRLLRALTPTQVLYVYFYYSEWMTTREIGALVGRAPSTISRTVRRGMANLEREFDGCALELHNVEALDAVLFDLYCQSGGFAPPVSSNPRQRARRGAEGHTPQAQSRPTEPQKAALRVFSGQKERHPYGRPPEPRLAHRFHAALKVLLKKMERAHVFKFLKRLIQRRQATATK